MGRPPHGGGPVFRFTPTEVVQMEACLQESNNTIPDRGLISTLADKFSSSVERAGKVVVQPKQVWNWFQNRRYAQRAKMVKAPGKLNVAPTPRDDPAHFRNLPPPLPAAPAKNLSDDTHMEFEAKSARDGAWYDVAQFISHRMFETGDPEVRVRFAGFGVEEDEWVNVRKCVRQRSLPCEASECVVVLPGDLILCFQGLLNVITQMSRTADMGIKAEKQIDNFINENECVRAIRDSIHNHEEGKEQALYFDAHVLDAQRRRHDARGCRCRFLVRYDHDQSEEIVPLRKACRRPETEYRLRILQATKAQGTMEPRPGAKDASPGDTSKDLNAAPQGDEKQQSAVAKSEEVIKHPPVPDEPVTVETADLTAPERNNRSASNIHPGE